MNKRMDIYLETNYYMRYNSEDPAFQGSRNWPKCDVNRPMRAPVSFTLQRNLGTNMY